MRVHVSIFGMQLIKIAHGFAMATIGSDNFQPILNHIWNATPRYDLDWLVGGYYRKLENNNFRHPAFIEDINLNGIKFVTVVISLFSDWGGPYYRVVVGFRKSSKIRRPFKRLKVLNTDGSNLHGENRPTIVDQGKWDYLCGNCDNVIIHGCNGILNRPIQCEFCKSICFEPRKDREFGHKMDDKGGAITRVHDINKNSEIHACVHGLGGGFIVHFVSPLERDDDNAFNYHTHADEAGLSRKEIKVI
jgi:hypothetical protein